MTVEQNKAEIEKLKEEKTQLKRRLTEQDKRIDALEYHMKRQIGTGNILVTLYVNQSGWSSAPSEHFVVDPLGNFGETVPVWTINKGEYVLMETYEVHTADHGKVRWIKIRTKMDDPTTTPDQFAWMPVNPKLQDCEELYEQLKAKDSDTEVDEYTQSIWDGMKEGE